METLQQRADVSGATEAELLRILKHVRPEDFSVKTRLIAAQVSMDSMARPFLRSVAFFLTLRCGSLVF